jgi:hypothetical protein
MYFVEVDCAGPDDIMATPRLQRWIEGNEIENLKAVERLIVDAIKLHREN